MLSLKTKNKNKNRGVHEQLILGIIFCLLSWFVMACANLVFLLAVQETGPAIHSPHPGER
jgi:hypothetical protein